MRHPSFSRKLAVTWLLLWLGGAALLAVFPQEVERHQLANALQTHSLQHPLGFDAFGRDLLLITLQASSLSAAFAAFATLAASLLALAAGTLTAVAPHVVQFALTRTLETLLAFPSLLFALAWAAVRGPGWDTLAVSLLLGSVPSLTRLVQARAHEILAEDYVLAARSLGASSLRIATQHLSPGVTSLLRVKIPNLFASALMAEATLSFLGIGAPIGRSSWGSLLAQGKDYLVESPHLAIGTGLPLCLTLLSLQALSSHSHSDPT